MVEHAVWVHSERLLPGLPRSGRCDQGFRRFEGEAAGKDREGLEEPLLVGRQEVVAPGDRVAQRALPVGEIAGAAREDIEPAIEPEQEGGGERTRVRAAANSIARGKPSSRRQISSTVVRLAPVMTKSGRIAFARWAKSATASET